MKTRIFELFRGGTPAPMLGVLVIALTVLSATPLLAQRAVGTSGWSESDFGASRLIAAVQAVGDASTVELGLHIRLNEGWKTYWRSPGDAGRPPRFNWSGSRNVENVAIDWPMPARFSLFGLDTIGYAEEVVLPITATLGKPGDAARLVLHVNYVVCKDICISVDAEHDIALPAGPGDETIFAGLIRRYRERVPMRSEIAQINVESATLVDAPQNELALEIVARGNKAFVFPEMVVEGPDHFHFGAPDWESYENGQMVVFRLPVYSGGALQRLHGERIRITLSDGAGTAIDREVMVE